MLSLSASGYAESINPFLVLYGNNPYFTVKDMPALAKYDLLMLDRFRFHEVNDNTWAAIKRISPQTKIYLYQAGPQVATNHDAHSIYYLNNMGRFNTDRGSKLGSIAKDHPQWFLKTAAGKPSSYSGYTSNHILDFGSESFTNYWIESTLNDISFQKWRADGVLVDNVIACRDNLSEQLKAAMPAMFRDCTLWNKGMNQYLARVTRAFKKEGQLIAANRGNSRFAVGTEGWLKLDQTISPPEVVLEEGAFALHWGDSDVAFLSEEEWKRQVDLPASIKRSSVAMISHTNLARGETGSAADDKRVSYEQVLRFSAGSYLLAKNAEKPTTYFMFVGNKDKDDYRKLIPAEMYSKFDIGEPVGTYNRLLSKPVYFRKYSDGYVYVNPTKETMNDIQLASGFRPEGSTRRLRKVGSAWYLDLPPYDAMIINKADPATVPKPPNFDLK